MKLVSVAVAAAFVVGAANPAAAYHLSPPQTSSRLTGTLLFTPNMGTKGPFSCKVKMLLKTGPPREPQIVSAITSSIKCVSTEFGDLPWGIAVISATTGGITPSSWIKAGVSHCQQTVVNFTVDVNGVFTFPTGGCFSGQLTSKPPITISP